MWTLNSAAGPATTKLELGARRARSDLRTCPRRRPPAPGGAVEAAASPRATSAASSIRSRLPRRRQVPFLHRRSPPACRRLTEKCAAARAPAAASSSTETPPEIAPSGPWDGLLFELRGAALEANCGPQADGAALEANLEQQRGGGRRARGDLRAGRHHNQRRGGGDVCARGGRRRRAGRRPGTAAGVAAAAVAARVAAGAVPSDAAPAFGLRCAWLSDAQLAALATRLDELGGAGPGRGHPAQLDQWLRHESTRLFVWRRGGGRRAPHLARPDGRRRAARPGRCRAAAAAAVAPSGGRAARRRR